jgi:hypothetical protein
MTTNPVMIPGPFRVLDRDEYLTAVSAAVSAMNYFPSRPPLDYGMAEEIVSAALAAVGVFSPIPVPESLEPSCTALYLPNVPDQFDASIFGEWQQCADEPGHEGDYHENPDVGWSDGSPGSVPAGAADEMTTPSGAEREN